MADFGIRVRVDESGLRADLQGVHAKFATAAKNIAAITIPVAITAGIARTVDELAELGEQAIKSAGALYDQSKQLGVSAEKLQEYRLIASAAGVSTEQFDKALGILNRTVGQSALGKGDFEKTLASVGMSLRDSEGKIKAVSLVYKELSDKVRDGSLSQAQSVALLAAAFGREGGKMVEVLRQTEEQQKAVIEAAREYGAILSNEVVAAADEYGDKLELIQKGTEALGTQSALILAPLTLKWAGIKNEIAGTIAELARASGLIDDNATLQARRLKGMEQQLEIARSSAKAIFGAGNEMQDPFLQFMTKEYEELKATIDATAKAAEAAAASIAPGGADADEGGADARIAFSKMEAGLKVKTIVDGLASATAGVAQHNKKMFQINKAAGIAQAVISTAQGVAKGVELGWPLGIPAVAWAALNGTAQIQAIKNTTYNGGGSGTTPSVAGSAPVMNSNPVGAGGGGTQRLMVEGISAESLFTGGAVRDLARRLLDFQRDGGVVVLK